MSEGMVQAGKSTLEGLRENELPCSRTVRHLHWPVGAQVRDSTPGLSNSSLPSRPLAATVGHSAAEGPYQTGRSQELQNTVVKQGAQWKRGHTLRNVKGRENQLKIPPVSWACCSWGQKPGPPAHLPTCLHFPERPAEGAGQGQSKGEGLREKPTSPELQAPTGAGALYSRILRKRSQVHAEIVALDVNNTPRRPRNPYELPGCLQCSRTGSVRKSEAQG